MTNKPLKPASKNQIESDNLESMQHQGWQMVARFRADADYRDTVMEAIVSKHPEKIVTFTSVADGILAWAKDREPENRIADLSAIEDIRQHDAGYLVGQLRIRGVSFEAEFIRVHKAQAVAQECDGGETACRVWKEFQALGILPFSTIKVPGFQGQWVLVISPKAKAGLGQTP